MTVPMTPEAETRLRDLATRLLFVRWGAVVYPAMLAGSDGIVNEPSLDEWRAALAPPYVTPDTDDPSVLDEITARRFTRWFLMQDRGKQADWMRRAAPALSDLLGWDGQDTDPSGHVRSYRGHCLTHGKECRFFEATDPSGLP
jgi:hypothetical protein